MPLDARQRIAPYQNQYHQMDTIRLGSTVNIPNYGWSFQEVQNFNGLFIGDSGSGKTYSIRNILARLPASIVQHILDVKGDFGPEHFEECGLGHLIDQNRIVTHDFSYVDGNAGVNILQFSREREGGGVYMAIQEVLSLMKIFNKSFSQKMSGYLQQILKSVYADSGIYHEDPETWTLACPNIGDVLNKVEEIIVQMEKGVNAPLARTLGRIKKVRAKIELTKSKLVALEPESPVADFNQDESEGSDENNSRSKNQLERKLKKYQEQLKELNTQAYAEFERLLGANDDEEEEDDKEILSWNHETMLAIRDTLKNIVECQIFTRPTPPRSRNYIHRYLLTGISPTHQQVIMRVVMGQVFSMARTSVRAGMTPSDPKVPSFLVIADEGKHAKIISQDALSPLNLICTEGRGYGAGFFCGVQNCSQLTEDATRSFATRAIFAVSPAEHATLKKNFRVTQHQLNRLVPQKNAIIQFSGKTDLVNMFQ